MDYAEFHNKISYIMFLHDYILACEISTLRTLTLTYMMQFIGNRCSRVIFTFVDYGLDLTTPLHS